MKIKSYLLKLSASACLGLLDKNLIFFRILKYIEKETDCMRSYKEKKML